MTPLVLPPSVAPSSSPPSQVGTAVVPPSRPLNVFILGGPATGKSTTIRLLEEGLRESPIRDVPVCRWDDFSRLYQMFAREKKDGFKYFRPDVGGTNTFQIVDDTVFEIVLKMLSDDLMARQGESGIHLIEFARGGSYERALQQFDPAILKRSLLYYLHCDPDKSIARNRGRKDEGDVDNHVVPDEVMRWYHAGITPATMESALRAAHVMYAAAISTMGTRDELRELISREISQRMIPYVTGRVK